MTAGPALRFWRYVGRTCKGFWRSVLMFMAAVVLLRIIYMTAERASETTVWIVGAIAAVSLWGIFFTWLNGRARTDTIKAIGELAKAGVQFVPQNNGGFFGGMGGLGFGANPPPQFVEQDPNK